ncbi:MAG: Unknown protein [uncultured Sulfurovum sp.]|uniref:Apea-like HEPN domain-containing protein n=1 Tax=uncultured Sulfurovum sp. TaxID=269237 RepID=A0A6S6S6Y8_9BACT|nr:MAG: Unknown protein [uncultured Sulfurovum sp.]
MELQKEKFLDWVVSDNKHEILEFYIQNPESKEEVESLYILTKNERTVFVSNDYMYVPLKISESKEELKEEVENLTENPSIPNKQMEFMVKKNPNDVDELSELQFISYLDNEDNITTILEKLNLTFLYIRVESNNFNLESQSDQIYFWIETILIQLSEKLNIIIEVYQKESQVNVSNETPFKNIIEIDNEIYFDELSLKYLSRAQKFYITAPHIAFLEYYHILERYMKDVKYNKYLESYQSVYTILSSGAEEIIKKEKVIKEVSKINKSLSEIELFKEVVEERLYNDLFSTLRSDKEKLKEAPPYIEEEQKSKIKISSNDSFQKKVIQRLYYTRNSIVHSKSFDGEDTFDPYNQEHIKFLEIDLYILKYIVIEFLKGKSTQPRLNHFVKFNNFTQ